MNSLGQLTSYVDADDNESKYTYDTDARLETLNDGRGTQTYGYDETTGSLKTLTDSDAGMFTATYDADGNLLTEGYPNGMTAEYEYDPTGTPVSLEYIKSSCNCTWFADKVTPSIHGQWITQESSLSKQVYSYDAAGRLTQVQSTPAGKGCVTRTYAYDEDTDRLSLATAQPNAKGECTSESQSVEAHAYDPSDRLNDAGVEYDALGNTSKLPAADAGGSLLTSTFYADNQLATQTQAGETIGYHLDPAGRTRETVETGAKKVAAVVSHFAGPGSAPAWTANSSSEWSRQIPGIDGSLAATKSSSSAEATLQLANLHGDIIATAYDSPSRGELASKADTTEFGVPTVNAPTKYSWLGAIDLPTAELPADTVAMGVRSYVPQIGRFLQPDPLPGGSANAYSYTFGDPVNSSDPSGAYTIGESSLAGQEAIGHVAQEGAAQQAAEDAAARREAEERLAAELAAYEAALGGGDEEWEEWEEWEEGAEEWEYASYQPEPNPTQGEPAAGSVSLYEPLQSGRGEPEAMAGSDTQRRCDAEGDGGPCARDTILKQMGGGVGMGWYDRLEAGAFQAAARRFPRAAPRLVRFAARTGPRTGAPGWSTFMNAVVHRLIRRGP
jgi:RHS repeat-associated protein